MPTPTPGNLPSIDSDPFEQKLQDRKTFDMFNLPPSIPLPALPQVKVSIITLEPAAVIEKVEEKKAVPKPRENVKILQSKSKIVVPDSGVTLKAIGREVQRLLYA